MQDDVDVDALLQELKRDKKPKQAKVKSRDLLSSGSTLLNLALSNSVKGAFVKGRYYHLVGSSDSGKSWLTMSTLAEATMNPEFKDYRLIHDNAENGVLMDVRRYFGKALHERLVPPRGTKENPEYSRTVEEFYYNLDDALDQKQPCIYVLDSMDALSADADDKKFHKAKASSRKGSNDEAGSFGMAKAKNNSAGMRIAFNKLQKTGSILIVISLAKVDMRPGMPPGSMTFSGGTALKSYCRGQIWTSKVGSMKKTVSKATELLANIIRIAVKKNHQTGRDVKVKIPLYSQTGFDDTGSCVDYLVERGQWKVAKKIIQADEFGCSLDREELIQRIEKENEEAKLRGVVAKKWEEIRLALVPQRKNRYAADD